MTSLNLITYVRFRGDISFKTMPFNEIDAAVLAMLSGLDISDIASDTLYLNAVWLNYRETHLKDKGYDEYSQKEQLLAEISEAKRYENVRLISFVKDIVDSEEKTFYAATFLIGFRKMFIAFRGTDGSLLSWKENFNTLYKLPTYGQTEAVSYLEAAVKKPFVKCIIAGHSKGGNLATYAGIFCNEKTRKKIDKVYSFDGPGFVEDLSSHPGRLQLGERLVSIVPGDSCVGRLMNTVAVPNVVESDSKGIFQHDIFSWVIEKSGFKRAQALSEASDSLSDKVNNWIYSMDIAERPVVTAELFDVLERNGINCLDDLINISLSSLLGIIKGMVTLSRENRELLIIVLKEIRQSRR